MLKPGWKIRALKARRSLLATTSAPAIIGYTEDERLVYDYDKMVRWLAKKESWDEVEAIEWIDYNTIRTIPYMGEKAPIIVYHDALC